jgi:hypothetical protein
MIKWVRSLRPAGAAAGAGAGAAAATAGAEGAAAGVGAGVFGVSLIAAESVNKTRTLASLSGPAPLANALP